MFIVGRHTRAEEQSGRSELVVAAPVGRFAPIGRRARSSSPLAQLLVGVLVALAMIGVDTPAAGSLALGASLAGVGLVFAGVAAVAAQVSQTTSSMYGITGARDRRARTCCAPRATSATARCRGCRRSAGARRCARTRASAGGRSRSRSSPGRGSSPAAVALRARRDEGAGLIAPRPGPATAQPSLTSPLGLAVRLQRGVLLGWSAGAVPQRPLDRPHRPRRREPRRRQRRDRAASSAPRRATSSTSTSPSRC